MPGNRWDRKQNVHVRLEGSILIDVDRLAQVLHTTRTGIIKTALRQFLKTAPAMAPAGQDGARNG